VKIFPYSIEPPKDVRILMQFWPYHYKSTPIPRSRHRVQGWARTPEPKWMEVHWVDKEEQTGSPPHWEEWTGDPNCSSSEHISPKDCIRWMHVPEEFSQ